MKSKFSFSPDLVLSASANIINRAGSRIPLAIIAEEISDNNLIPGFADLVKLDQEAVIKGVILMSEAYDIRAGRNGGAGRVEWYKGAKAKEPKTPAGELAKAIRGYNGKIGYNASCQIANRYVRDLMMAKTAQLPTGEIIRRYK